MAKSDRAPGSKKVERSDVRKDRSDRTTGTYKAGNYDQKTVRNDKEEDRDWSRVDAVPGASKNRSSFESKTKPQMKTRDIALDDGRVRDMEYDYTKQSWPGKMQPDSNLDRAIEMQIRHKPLTNANTND